MGNEKTSQNVTDAVMDGIVRLRIGQLRAWRHESQIDVAKALDVSLSTVKKWELGERRIKAADLRKLAEHFETTTDYLVGLQPTPDLDADTRKVYRETGLSSYTISWLKVKRLSAEESRKNAAENAEPNINISNPAMFLNFLSEVKSGELDVLQSHVRNLLLHSIRRRGESKRELECFLNTDEGKRVCERIRELGGIVTTDDALRERELHLIGEQFKKILADYADYLMEIVVHGYLIDLMKNKGISAAEIMKAESKRIDRSGNNG